jgi:transcription elongation factor GreA
VAEHLEYAKKLGDLSENAEYHQAREEQAEVEDRIQRLENLLKNASMIQKTAGHDTIVIGTTFRLQKEGDNKSYLYELVGSEEANIAQGRVSNLSPLGSSLLGRKVGESVTVMTPKGKVTYTVAAIK